MRVFGRIRDPSPGAQVRLFVKAFSSEKAHSLPAISSLPSGPGLARLRRLLEVLAGPRRWVRPGRLAVRCPF